MAFSFLEAGGLGRLTGETPNLGRLG